MQGAGFGPGYRIENGWDFVGDNVNVSFLLLRFFDIARIIPLLFKLPGITRKNSKFNAGETSQ